MEIRKLTALDLPALQELCLACRDFQVLTTGREPGPADGEDLFMDCPPGKSPGDKEIFGLMSWGKAVGVIELLRDYPAQGTWFIGLMLVHPCWRGKGLGRDALAWLEQYLAEQKVGSLSLAVLAENPLGLRFWEHNGFQQIRIVENYQSGAITTAAYVMLKTIGQARDEKRVAPACSSC